MVKTFFFCWLRYRHQRTNNVMERYNREFVGKFTTGSPNLFVFCDVIQAKSQKWVQRHEEAKRGTFTCRQNRKDVDWPDIPEDFV